jgi:class 3 adenylate cyclase
MAVIRFKVYIGTIFFCLGALLLTVVFTTLYFTLQAKVFDETVDRLTSTVTLGAQGLDTRLLTSLAKKLSQSPMSDDEVAQVEASPEYREISASLNRIRKTNPNLILYVYFLVPTADPDKARFLVDADVLRLREEARRTGKPSEAISGFGLEYDIHTQPVTRQVLTEKTPGVEPRFIFDEIYQVNSMMALAPVFDRETGQFIGALGVDISDRNYRAFLFGVFVFSIVVTVLLLIIIVLASLMLAARISRPIVELTDAVKRFGNPDYGYRVNMKTSIKELYDLQSSFNSTAAQVETYHRDLEGLNRSLERFVPVEFLEFLGRKDLTQAQLGDQVQCDMAVMFCDIRSFSSLSEHLTPKQTFNFLNAYLARIAPIIRRHNGFVDKYIGDGIMAVFPGKVEEAVRCAVEMVLEVRKINLDREAQGLPPISTGTGIHTGSLMLGTIGEAQRMQTTVIADSVNVASRLESLTKELGAKILVSREVFDRLSDPEEFMIRFIGTVQVRGKTETASVLEVFDGDSATLREHKAHTRKDFEKAVALVAAGSHADAAAILSTLAQASPADAGVAHYLHKAQAG